MSNDLPQLPENVYPFPSMPPGKDDADSNGNVLWFHPARGWHQGWWKRPVFDGTTHWTYLPQCPPSVEPQDQKSERLFTEWVASFNHTFNESALSLMKLGWDGAIKKTGPLP